ncbi:putative reverse transcriptase domain-containing protein [Tanacetum coccineum]
MAQVRKLSPEQLQEEFDKIQRAVAFTRGLKSDGSPMSTTSSKKHKTGDVEVDVEAPSHGVSQEVEVEVPSHGVSQEVEVEAPSQDEAIVEDVEVPSNIASKVHPTASSLKKIGTKKKRLGRKGVHTSHSTIPIEEGDPDAEHKLCIKYASDEDSASDCDTPVHLYVVIDWELLPTRLGSINAIYKLDNSRKYFTSLREILHLVTRVDLMTIYGRVMTFYQDKKAEGVGLVLSRDLQILMDSPKVNDGICGLVIHMFVDKKYPFSINLIERMLDHQLEIYGTVGNELTTAVQLIAFLKKQISDSRRPKVHDCPRLDADFLVADSKFMKVAFGVGFKMIAVPSSGIVTTSRYVVPTGRVKVPAGRYVVPTGKDNVIVSTGRTKVIPAGRTILVLLAVDEPVDATVNNKDVSVGRKAMNFRTLFTPGGNRVDVVVSMESIRAISERFANTGKYELAKSMLNSSTGIFPFQFSSMDGLDAILEHKDVGNVLMWVKLHGVPVTVFSKDGLSVIATKLGTVLMLDSYTSNMCIQSWGGSSYARAMIEVRADVELKDTIVVAMPKLTGGFYTCNVRVEYEWKPPRCACCKVFGHVLAECPNNIDSDVGKNMKKPSQTPRGVLVGPKVGFKPVKQVFRQVSRKNNVNTNCNKKKDAVEVSNSNPFDVLNSVENDVDLGTNGGSPNLTSKKANTSGFLSGNAKSSSTSNTHMVEKIDKMERLIIEGKVTLVDDKGKPLKKVDYLGDHDSKDEVASTDNDMANFMASKKDSYGNNSLLEQWKESYMNGDYDFDPYDDDMYEYQDILDKIHDICNYFEITVRGRKKK